MNRVFGTVGIDVTVNRVLGTVGIDVTVNRVLFMDDVGLETWDSCY